MSSNIGYCLLDIQVKHIIAQDTALRHAIGGMKMQNQAIQVKGLQKSYKQLHVLKGVDFEVPLPAWTRQCPPPQVVPQVVPG